MFKIIKSGAFEYSSKDPVIIQKNNNIKTFVKTVIHITPDGIYSDNVKYASQCLQDYTEKDDLSDWLTKEQQLEILKENDAQDDIISIQEICAVQFNNYVELVKQKCIDGSSEDPVQYLYKVQTLADIYGYMYDSGVIDTKLIGHRILRYNDQVFIINSSIKDNLIVLEIPDDLGCNGSIRECLNDQTLAENTVRACDIYNSIQYNIQSKQELDKILDFGIFNDKKLDSVKTDGDRYLSALGLRDKDFVKWLTRYLSNNLNEQTSKSADKIQKAINNLADTVESSRKSEQDKLDVITEAISKLDELISNNTESDKQVKQAIESLAESYRQAHTNPVKFKEVQYGQFDEQEAKTADQIIRENTNNSDDILEKIKKILKFKKAIILAGAPGTGKTTIARCIAKELTSENKTRDAYINVTRADGTQYRRCEREVTGALKKYLEVVQFSASYSYEDFVSGLKTDENGNWTLTPGAFKIMCDRAQKDENNKYVLIIDEINRANTEEVLGEMFNLMESRGIEIKSRTGEKLVMPENLYIIATMNNVDKGAGQLDMATISRFAVVNIEAPSAEQMISNVHKIPACQHNFGLRDKLIVAIDLIDNLNKLISEDTDAAVLNKKALKLGYRSLFSKDISQVDDINLLIEYDIRQDMDARQDKLSEQTYKDCIEAIENAIIQEKIENNTDKVIEQTESDKSDTDIKESGEQS